MSGWARWCPASCWSPSLPCRSYKNLPGPCLCYDEAENRGKDYIFGYGSLVSSADVARTLGRHPEFIYPITLNGWIREWGIVIDNAGAQHRSVRLADGTVVPGCIVVLNVRRPTAQERPTHPNGVLFEVTEAELLLMDARETHYDRHEVTQDITGGPPGVIYTYVGRDQHLLRPT